MAKGIIKGYKVFSPNFTCRGYQYAVGKTYKHQGEINICNSGFHYCNNLIDCFDFYTFDPNNRVAEIEAIGEVKSSKNKSVTDKIKIVRELTWGEVLELLNEGKGNSGRCNSGNRNSGSCNSGSCNSGDCNSGNWNSGNSNSGNSNSGDGNLGNWNSGDCNSGDCNSGRCNSGDYNSGSWNSGNNNSGECNSGRYNSGNVNSGNENSGDYNSGDYNSGNNNSGNNNSGNNNSGDGNSGNWNSGNWNSGMFNMCDHTNGLFNSKSPKIYMFNKPTRLTYKEFKEKYSEVYKLLMRANNFLNEWVPLSEMTDEEKADNPNYAITRGYLKHVDYKTACKKMWGGFTDAEKESIKALPNFSSKVFKEIMGIEVNAKN